MKLSPTGKQPIIVLDACTILNLLRIDDESDFLLKQIEKWRVHLPETVFKEMKDHVRSDFYTLEKNDHMLIVINQTFDQRKTFDAEIKHDLDETFENIVKFSNHNKRENGELYCVALALVKSRCEEEMITIYTDDYKATEEFTELYRFHRIGDFGDTTDLLTAIYWMSPEDVFQKGRYMTFLENLRAEYNHQLYNVTRAMENYLSELKRHRSKDRDLLTHLGLIVDGYRQSDFKKMEEGVKYFQNDRKYKTVRGMLGDLDVNSINEQMAHINAHFKRLKDYSIFKLA